MSGILAKLQYGLSVALVGIGTVFVGLVILIVLIKVMEMVIHGATGSKKAPVPAAAAPAPAPAPAVVEEEPEEFPAVVSDFRFTPPEPVSAAPGEKKEDGRPARSRRRRGGRGRGGGDAVRHGGAAGFGAVHPIPVPAV